MFGFKTGKGAVVVDGKHVADTIQCVHCGMHWVPKAGSGATRGWCKACNGFCCGKRSCMTCVPFEALVECEEGIIKPGNKYFDRFFRIYGTRL